MRCLSLFSGIGGIDLAAQTCGFDLAAFCEIDPFCRSVLQTHWPDVPIYADVKEVSNARLERDGVLPIDLVYGGPPCQPASLAGQRRGQQDDRWLWPDFLRVVGEVRPRWCVAENPVGILSVDAGRAWGTILGTLVEMGYGCGWGVWGAGDVGAPHRRERVFLLGYHPDVPVADSFGHRQWIGPDQPESQSARGSAPDIGLDGAQSILADAAGQRYERGIAGNLDAREAAGDPGMEFERERCRSLAHAAGRQRRWRAQSETGWGQVSGERDLWPNPGGRSDALADSASREDRWNGEQGVQPDLAAERSAVADPKGGQCQRGGLAWRRQSRSTNRGDALDNPAGARLEERSDLIRNAKEERSPAFRASDGDRGTDESEAVVPQRGLGRGADGLSAWVDAPIFPAGPGQVQAAWEPPRTIPRGVDPYRRKRLHALGNAVVPAQIAPLFRAIAGVEKHHSRACASGAEDMGTVWARQHGERGKGNDMATWDEDLRIREYPVPLKTGDGL